MCVSKVPVKWCWTPSNYCFWPHGWEHGLIVPLSLKLLFLSVDGNGFDIVSIISKRLIGKACVCHCLITKWLLCDFRWGKSRWDSMSLSSSRPKEREDPPAQSLHWWSWLRAESWKAGRDTDPQSVAAPCLPFIVRSPLMSGTVFKRLGLKNSHVSVLQFN